MTLFRSLPHPVSRLSAARVPTLPVALASFALTALTTLFPARAAAAPIDRTLFTYSGRVDREIYLVVRGRDVRIRGEDAGLPARVRVSDALPRTGGLVLVQRLEGRGEIDILEQPNSRNGYQATIRIRDPRGGDDSYRLTAYWQGDDRGDDRYDRGRDDRGRDDRGRDDRGRDDRDRRDDCRASNNGRGWGWGRSNDCDDRDRDDRNRDDRNRDDRNRGRDDRDNRGGYGDGRGTDPRGGYESGVLTWSGRVDDVVEVRISGRRVDAITRSGAPVQDVATNLRGGALPQRDVTVQIDQRSGRGSIEVVQQPSAWNGYTAVLRIRDPRAGSAFYDFSVRW